MNLELGTSILKLKPDGILALRDAAGSRLVCEGGALWITQEGSSDDVILLQGDSFRVRDNGLTLAMAMRPAEIRVIEPKRSRFDAVSRWLHRLMPRGASLQAAA